MRPFFFVSFDGTIRKICKNGLCKNDGMCVTGVVVADGFCRWSGKCFVHNTSGHLLRDRRHRLTILSGSLVYSHGPNTQQKGKWFVEINFLTKIVGNDDTLLFGNGKQMFFVSIGTF